MKKNNPYIPIMIREASGTEPRVWARYEFGRERMEDLRGISYTLLQQHGQYAQRLTGFVGLDDKAIEDKVTTLVKDGP
jgi:NADH dehydrogenase (ubiquinone) 1 alpha subcomplex subunit 2